MENVDQLEIRTPARRNLTLKNKFRKTSIVPLCLLSILSIPSFTQDRTPYEKELGTMNLQTANQAIIKTSYNITQDEEIVNWESRHNLPHTEPRTYTVFDFNKK